MSNSSTLTYDGVRGSILNEEIRRQSSEEEGTSVIVMRGRSEKRNANASRRRSKSKEEGSNSKGKGDVTCYQCGRKGHKKLDCKYYKAELERKKD